MAQEVIEKPRETAAKAAVNGQPAHEGPVSKKDLLLKSISERCTVRFKCRIMEAAFAGPKCSADAAVQHLTDGNRDPEAETKGISLELLPLKFDISREAYGTGDTYVVIKSGENLSFFALHGIIRQGEEQCGIATLALRLPPDLVPEMIAEMKSDPAFIDRILHSVLPSASALSFSIKTRIDVVFDRNYLVFRNGAE